jgi:hypothetical protein
MEGVADAKGALVGQPHGLVAELDRLGELPTHARHDGTGRQRPGHGAMVAANAPGRIERFTSPTS